MMPPRRIMPRLLGAVAIVTAPVAVALLVLAAAGALPLWAALAVIALAALASGLLIRRHLLHLLALARHLGAVAAEPGHAEAATMLPHGPALAPELGAAVAEAGRAWRARRRELEAVVSANETILASLPEPLILLDAQRRVVRANPAADALFETALAGRELAAVLRHPALSEAVDSVLGGGAGRVVELTQSVPAERWLSARIERLPRRSGDGTVCLMTLHDLSQIRRADRMRADFVANASHELRTPLSTLSGFIETLMGPARDDPQARERFLGIMHEQAGRMARVVRDLLSLSRIELNEHSPPQGIARLDRVVGSVAETLQLKAGAKGMTIALDAPPPEGAAGPGLPLAELPAVSGDADELAQVFQNLIDNAIKYGRAGSAIRIAGWTETAPAGAAAERRAEAPVRRTGRRPPHAVAIAVSDQGEGIPREHLPRLTERFYRVDSARSRDLGGTGLGLAIVKHILNRHRGGLQIESTPGVGSTFTVLLPAAPAPAEPEPGISR